jgi:amino acid transporter
VGDTDKHDPLHRHFGPLHATALNLTMIVGVGVFATIPLMLKEVPGPYALLGWVVAGVLILLDGLVWSELGAALPGSGGSTRFLLESFGPNRWGRLFAFLFIWQFLLSGPMELASGLIAMDTFSRSLSPAWDQFNRQHTLPIDLWKEQGLALTLCPGRFLVFGVGLGIVALLYRRVAILGRFALVLSLGVLGLVGWTLIEGAIRFDASTFFDFGGRVETMPSLASSLGPAMALALYSYLGYYHICYLGDEVHEPGRTIPRAVLVSAGLVVLLFGAVHLAMLGTVSWQSIPTDDKALESYSLPAAFFGTAHGHWAVVLVTLLILASAFASCFSGMLGYSRIPYAAARQGHFFAVFGRVHPTLRIPHVSLLLVGALTMMLVFFDLGQVINALITTRIIEQFLAQTLGLVLLRRLRPELIRPFRVPLYPLPLILSSAGWVYVYGTSQLIYIVMGLVTLLAGVGAFLLWSWWTKGWPFAAVANLEDPQR